MNPGLEQTVSIKGGGDIVAARRAVREAAQAVGFGLTDVTRIVTAASELARNICKYAGEGVMHLRQVERDGRTALELEFADNGPGIADLDQAMGEGYSTSGGLGLGLPGSKRLMDEMELQSTVGSGTTVSVRKWLKSQSTRRMYLRGSWRLATRARWHWLRGQPARSRAPSASGRPKASRL